MSGPFENHSDKTFVHQRWGSLADAMLIAVCGSYYEATVFAKAMALRQANDECAYVTSGGYEGKQFAWVKSLAEADAAKARGAA